ncbi:WD40 repeat domain-containing protein [Bacillus safensis]|uniref:WD40 repeat domain-containing protein n=1 Tax=Bacillus safensis TaxID=561879 RepID=UPI0038053970
MTIKKISIFSLIFIIFILFVYHFKAGEDSKTIIIPSNEGQPVNDRQKSSFFQVKNIYPIPKLVKLIGWSSPDSIIGFFYKNASEKQSNQLQRLSSPYDRPKNIETVSSSMSDFSMSPDGKKLIETTTSSTNISLSLKTSQNEKKEIKRISPRNELFVQTVTWSNNSKWMTYLIVDPLNQQTSKVGIYDTETGKLKTLPLLQIDNKASLINVAISDDGQRLLLTTSERSGSKKRIYMGNIKNDHVALSKEYQNSYGDPIWLNRNQFVYIGVGNTLYEYDQRNGDISALLENVTNVELSNDRKKIAYSLYGDENIYAGNLQGKNILYKESIYHSTIPLEMAWSIDGNSLLVYYPLIENRISSNSYVITFH